MLGEGAEGMRGLGTVMPGSPPGGPTPGGVLTDCAIVALTGNAPIIKHTAIILKGDMG